MNIKNIEGKVSKILVPKEPDFEFVYDLLLAYGKAKPSITRLKKGTYNLATDKDTEIYWKNNLLFKHVPHQDLHETIDDLKRSKYGTKYSPRFVIVTDFDQLLAVDMRTEETLDIPLAEIARHYAFFLPWAGMEKSQIQTENEADIKAAERMAKLYDEIIRIEDNAINDPQFLHSLNIFFSRLLFCFFAEDTEVFEKSQFTRSISSHTQLDGSDLNDYLDELFSALDVEEKSDYPAHIAAFPYVNGGLFNKQTPVPKFSTKARRLILECGELNWSEINPDIFGSMIQAVVHPGQRAGLGMHYTSVVNIMKVIEPLFLEELKEELDHASGDRQKLENLLKRIYDIKVFDPACGSGNFLIIAYKELRKIEHEIIEQLMEGKLALRINSGLKLENFYGIEIDDFAREIAVLSLWLAKHQMNIEFKNKFGKDIPLIPLKDTGYITCANAARIDWEKACPNNGTDEIYLIGNPPYQGAKRQDINQRSDYKFVFDGHKYPKNLDYISLWFIKGKRYIENTNSKLAFVSTNSLVQGEQVSLLWPYVYEGNVEIGFAYTSFRWANSAKGNAVVTCVIIGLCNKSNEQKTLFIDSLKLSVSHINSYLAPATDVVIGKRSHAISDIPEMVYGNMPLEGNFLKLNSLDKNKVLDARFGSERFIRRLVGGDAMLQGTERYCLWIENKDLDEAMLNPEIKARVNAVKKFRENAGEVAKTLSTRPHQFRYRKTAKKSSIAVPCTTSERRSYMPCDIFNADVILDNSVQVIYDAESWVFGLVSSKMHMTWVKAVAGRLKTDLRYSSALAYNNYPVPSLSDKQKDMITNQVFQILDAREKYSENTLAELYDPEKMPDELRLAHDDLDEVIDRCYRVKSFDNDEDRLAYLFKLYEIMTQTQKELI
jgi:hypothetical protein